MDFRRTAMLAAEEAVANAVDAIGRAPAAQQAPAVQAQISPGAIAIAEERARQMAKEGWTPEHDDEHGRGELACAAACYAVHHTDARVLSPENDTGWPWARRYWKPGATVRNLEKAGALIAAEIDRLLRKDGAAQQAPATLCVVCDKNNASGKAWTCPCGKLSAWICAPCGAVEADPDTEPDSTFCEECQSSVCAPDEPEAAQQAPAPAPATPAAAEPLSLDRYTRTAVQVALTTALPEPGATMGEAVDCLLAQRTAEDFAIERAAALLTPAGRLALAAELLEPLGLVSISILPHDFDALAAGQCVNEKIEGRDVVRSVLFYLGKVSLHLFQQRPASLDDARRLLEKR